MLEIIKDIRSGIQKYKAFLDRRDMDLGTDSQSSDEIVFMFFSFGSGSCGVFAARFVGVLMVRGAAFGVAQTLPKMVEWLREGSGTLHELPETLQKSPECSPNSRKYCGSLQNAPHSPGNTAEVFGTFHKLQKMRTTSG